MFILDYISNNAKNYPEKIAIKDKDNKFSYEELNFLVNYFATEIYRVFGSHKRLLLKIEHNAYMPIIIFACLKSHNTYVPIDIKSGINDLNRISQSVASKYLISEEKIEDYECLDLIVNLEASRKKHGCAFFTLDDLPASTYEEDDEIYILHTSGSTGMPKGVVITYKNLSYILQNMDELCPCSFSDCYLLSTPYTFDVSVSEIYGWLKRAGSCYVDSLKKLELYKGFASIVERYKISHLAMSPSTFHVLLSNLDRLNVASVNKYLKYAMIAGERFLPIIQKQWVDLGLACHLFNFYGPTEATVYATYYELTRDKYLADVPIGQALKGASVLIDNKANNPYDEGELLILGEGLAKSYTDEKLTEEKFVCIDGKRAYRTGDIAKFNEADELIYLGRNDSQIQRNGIRLEIGEIEFRIHELDEVKECRVYFKDDNIYAFVIRETGFVSSETEFREFINKNLPQYMRPNAIIFLEKFLFNMSNKLDFAKMLSEWKENEFRSESRNRSKSKNESELDEKEKSESYESVKLSDGEQAILSDIKSFVLEIKSLDDISLDSDIVAAGFDSLDLVRLAILLEKRFNITLELDDLYANRNIYKLLSLILYKLASLEKNKVSSEASASEPSGDLSGVFLYDKREFKFEAETILADKLKEILSSLITKDEAKLIDSFPSIHTQRSYLRNGLSSVVSLKVRLEKSTGECEEILRNLIKRERILWSRFKDTTVIYDKSKDLFIEECEFTKSIPILKSYGVELDENLFRELSEELIFSNRDRGGYLATFLIQDMNDYKNIYLALDHSIADGASMTILRKLLSTTDLNANIDSYQERASYKDYCLEIIDNNNLQFLKGNANYFKSVSDNQLVIDDILARYEHKPVCFEIKDINPRFDSLELTMITAYVLGSYMAKSLQVNKLMLRSLLNIRDLSSYKYKDTIGDIHTGYIVPFETKMSYKEFKKEAYKVLDLLKTKSFRAGYIIERYSEACDALYPGMREKYIKIASTSINFLGDKFAREKEDFIKEVCQIQDKLNKIQEGIFVTSFRVEDSLIVVASRDFGFDEAIELSF